MRAGETKCIAFLGAGTGSLLTLPFTDCLSLHYTVVGEGVPKPTHFGTGLFFRLAPLLFVGAVYPAPAMALLLLFSCCFLACSCCSSLVRSLVLLLLSQPIASFLLLIDIDNRSQLARGAGGIYPVFLAGVQCLKNMHSKNKNPSRGSGGYLQVQSPTISYKSPTISYKSPTRS